MGLDDALGRVWRPSWPQEPTRPLKVGWGQEGPQRSQLGQKSFQNRSWRPSWRGLEAILAARANKTPKS
eukprot:10680028-Karenia_brevis.AAC.1